MSLRTLGRAILIGGAVVLLESVIPYSTHAAESMKVGVIDPQAVLEKSKAGRRALDALKEYAEARRRLLTSDEEELKNLEKQLKDGESAMTDAQKKDKTSQFRVKVQDYQKRAQEFNQEFSAKQKDLVDDYMKRISSATRTVAERGGFTVVVDKGSENTIKIVIYARESLDLTDQVIKEFDKMNK